ncbi:hypothetical protein AAVH_04030 [Aphelenchoides avenae]|nr:hypothetical protein AAVH_04030 [Aphelenchus avenae]
MIHVCGVLAVFGCLLCALSFSDAVPFRKHDYVIRTLRSWRGPWQTVYPSNNIVESVIPHWQSGKRTEAERHSQHVANSESKRLITTGPTLLNDQPKRPAKPKGWQTEEIAALCAGCVLLVLLIFVGCCVACYCYCKRTEARRNDGSESTFSASRSAEQPRVPPQTPGASAAVQPPTPAAASRSVSNRGRIPTEVIPHEKFTFKGPITCFQLQRVNLHHELENEQTEPSQPAQDVHVRFDSELNEAYEAGDDVEVRKFGYPDEAPQPEPSTAPLVLASTPATPAPSANIVIAATKKPASKDASTPKAPDASDPLSLRTAYDGEWKVNVPSKTVSRESSKDSKPSHRMPKKPTKKSSHERVKKEPKDQPRTSTKGPKKISQEAA